MANEAERLISPAEVIEILTRWKEAGYRMQVHGEAGEDGDMQIEDAQVVEVNEQKIVFEGDSARFAVSIGGIYEWWAEDSPAKIINFDALGDAVAREQLEFCHAPFYCTLVRDIDTDEMVAVPPSRPGA